MRASRLRWLIPMVILVAVVLIPLAAWGQTPPPGEEPEVVRPWTWWLAIPVALGALGLALFIAMRYVRVSSRFFAREEAPRIPERPRAYAGVNAPAYPAPAAAQPAPAPAAAPAPQQEAAPPRQEPVQPEPEPAEAEEPEPEPAEAEAPEAEAPEAEIAEERKPAQEEEPSEEGPPGEDVYERVLKEQLDKGVSPKVAEGRAKAAAHRARQSG